MRELTKEEILSLKDECGLNIISEYFYEHFIKENGIKFYEPDNNLDKNKFIKIEFKNNYRKLKITKYLGYFLDGYKCALDVSEEMMTI